MANPLTSEELLDLERQCEQATKRGEDTVTLTAGILARLLATLRHIHYSLDHAREVRGDIIKGVQ